MENLILQDLLFQYFTVKTCTLVMFGSPGGTSGSFKKHLHCPVCSNAVLFVHGSSVLVRNVKISCICMCACDTHT